MNTSTVIGILITEGYDRNIIIKILDVFTEILTDYGDDRKEFKFDTDDLRVLRVLINLAA